MRWERRWMEIETRRNHFFSWIVIRASRNQKFLSCFTGHIRGKIENYLKVTSWFLQIFLATIYLYEMRHFLWYLTVSIPPVHHMLSKEAKILLFLLSVSLGLEAVFIWFVSTSALEQRCVLWTMAIISKASYVENSLSWQIDHSVLCFLGTQQRWWHFGGGKKQ